MSSSLIFYNFASIFYLLSPILSFSSFIFLMKISILPSLVFVLLKSVSPLLYFSIRILASSWALLFLDTLLSNFMSCLYLSKILLFVFESYLEDLDVFFNLIFSFSYEGIFFLFFSSNLLFSFIFNYFSNAVSPSYSS